MAVKVRFAPSPTGNVHIGNIRSDGMVKLPLKGNGEKADYVLIDHLNDKTEYNSVLYYTVFEHLKKEIETPEEYEIKFVDKRIKEYLIENKHTRPSWEI